MVLAALDEQTGQNVDWWFIYKLPDDLKPLKSTENKTAIDKTKGTEYLYCDAKTPGELSLSKVAINDKNSALSRTLNQISEIKDKKNSNSSGWIIYNDEIPENYNEKDNDRNGHTKGILAFDLETDSAFWILHSWPKFPSFDTDMEPSNEYGQTYLCISLKDVATAEKIAQQMSHQQEPQIYDCQMPANIDKNSALYLISQAVDVNEKDPAINIEFSSRGGQKFNLLAKNRYWDKDFWVDWVGPQLKVDFNIETWRRGTLPPTDDSDGRDDVKDILYINLESLGVPFEWHYTKDHAKWATSDTNNWVVIADMNRQTSQEKRGGGGIAFQSESLWEKLSRIEQYKQ